MKTHARLLITAILSAIVSLQISQPALAVCWFCWTDAINADEANSMYQYMDQIDDDLDDLEQAKEQASDPEELNSLDAQISELRSLWTYTDILSQVYDDLQKGVGPCPNGCGTDSEGNDIEENPQVPENSDPFGLDPSDPSDAAVSDGASQYV